VREREREREREILREEHRQRVFESRVLRKISLICDKSVTTQNLAFLS
jgi:hypothetical protein